MVGIAVNNIASLIGTQTSIALDLTSRNPTSRASSKLTIISELV